ncbi:MAG: glutamine-hydrolyzing GMP synthase [Fidelibacterota bacterium]
MISELHQGVVILDFGSQYTQLIARRIRELHVYSEIVSHDISRETLQAKHPAALILSGGPSSVFSDESPDFDRSILSLDIPVLGICYGLQLLTHEDGGRVESKGKGEYGSAQFIRKSDSALLAGMSQTSQVWMSHMDQVTVLPPDWTVIGTSSNGLVAALENRKRQWYATQFHPEVAHTTEGEVLIRNFVYHIAGCRPDWTPGQFIQEQIAAIREEVQDQQVLIGVSGGVDSTVVAALLNKAIGDKAIAVMIDHGLMRKNEAEQTVIALRDGMEANIHVFDESEIFLKRLQGVEDPEEKRKIIGDQFIRSFEKISRNFGNIKFLAQGTLYPDVIESGNSAATGVTHVIKSHHNVGGLPDNMQFKLIEPLRELFKDEVRNVGRELGLPDGLINRHPFPGPGLAVRIIGEITPERCNLLRNADDIFINILHEHNLYNDIWQAFSVLIPVKTVGVMGDQRTYENLLALRAVHSTDGMTADWVKLPSEVLSQAANVIVNSVKGINRVVYDITSKPPGTIEWE